MSNSSLFFGRSFDYWLELQKSVDNNSNNSQLIAENAKLRAKVNFFEQQTKQALAFIAVVDGMK